LLFAFAAVTWLACALSHAQTDAAARAQSVERNPAKPGAAAGPSAATSFEKPAAAGYKDGIPVGLFFMTRYWFATRSLEKAAWYFAPDHTVYQQLETGFSKADLAAHRGNKGTARLVGSSLEVTWASGKKTTSNLERDKDSLGFAWDGGLFGPVEPMASAADVVGVYEGGESVSFGGGSSSVAKGLELRADGTFSRSAVSSINTASQGSRVSAGATGSTTGTWQLAGYSLVLVDETGKAFRGIVFPYDDAKTPVKPDRLFFAGTMYKKKP
jgi:hypothetical protein